MVYINYFIKKILTFKNTFIHFEFAELLLKIKIV